MVAMKPWGITRKVLKRMLATRRNTLKPDTKSRNLMLKREAIVTLSVYEMRIRTELSAGARHRAGA